MQTNQTASPFVSYLQTMQAATTADVIVAHIESKLMSTGFVESNIDSTSTGKKIEFCLKVAGNVSKEDTDAISSFFKEKGVTFVSIECAQLNPSFTIPMGQAPYNANPPFGNMSHSIFKEPEETSGDNTYQKNDGKQFQQPMGRNFGTNQLPPNWGAHQDRLRFTSMSDELIYTPIGADGPVNYYNLKVTIYF
jgi:hypothetical protein